jgi:hypothetical protein
VALPVRQALEATLAAVVAGFAAAGRTLPDRRYVTGGQVDLVARDCPQLTVTLTAVNPAPAGLAPAGTLTPRAVHGARLVRSAEIVIELVECYPTVADDGEPPAAAALNAAGLDQADQVAALSDAIVTAFTTGLLTHVGALLGPVVPLGPEGGIVAARATLTVDLLTWPA